MCDFVMKPAISLSKDVRERYYFSIRPSVWHAVSNISTERGDFAIACHQLRNLDFNCTDFCVGYPHMLENFYAYFRVTWTPNIYNYSHFYEEINRWIIKI